nr:SGNH/GDSL hydrolase family protein [Sphingomonas beigongshangi]
MADGDSITKYSQAAGDGWDSYARLWKTAHPSVDYSVVAVGGSIIGTPGDAAGTNSLYGRLASNLALNPTHVSIFDGANDMIGYADAQSFVNALFALTDRYKQAGAKVIVGTVLPRTGQTGWNARRAQVNPLIRAAVGSRIDDVFDFDTSYMGQDGAENSTANYVDGLHPTAAGQAALLQVYQIPWNYLLGIPNEPLNFSFAPATNATANTDITSATYTVSGLHAGESRPYQAGSGAYVSKNGGAFTLAGTGSVINGDTLALRIRSSTTAAGQVNATLTVGTTSATFTVTTAGAGSRDWVPTDLGAKLAMWQKPETLGADTTAVNVWADQSGKGNDLTIDTAGSGTPKVVANAINSLKAVRFDPAQNAGLKPPTSLLTGRTSLATFFISRNTLDPNTANFGAPLGSWGTETGDYWIYTDGGVYSGYGTNTRRDNMNPPGTTTDWHQFMIQSAPNDWRISQDGTDFGNFSANTVSVGTAPKIGCSPGIGDYYDGYMAEIVDLNAAPTTTERQLVEGYLAWKFGLQANLPANHPYKSAKPTTSG